jgi:hypothetical protein
MLLQLMIALMMTDQSCFFLNSQGHHFQQQDFALLY